MATCPFSNCAINTPYDKRPMREQTSFLPTYSPQSYNQTSSYFMNGYPTTTYNLLSQYGTTSALNTTYMNKYHDYEQKRKYYHNTQRNYWTPQMNTTVLSMYDRPNTTYYKTGTVYPLETNFHNYDPTLLDARRRLVYDPYTITTAIYPAQLDYTTAYLPNIRPLPPKIRAIFVPAYCSPSQICAGPLRIPPFLYDGASQPTFFLPSPPSLPTTTSFYTPNDLTQMVAQSYGYSTMPFFYPSNYQFPQTTLPMLSSPPYQSVVSPDRTSAYSTQSPSSFNTFNQTVQLPQYNSVNYSTAKYAYPPASYSFNSLTVPNYGTQSNTVSSPYAPAVNGRISPLLGRSTILQYAPNPVKNQYSYPYYDKYSLSKSWSQNLPPLPPGAIVILDEYIDTKVSSAQQHLLKKKQKRSRRAHKFARRAIRINSNDTRIIQPIRLSSLSDTNDAQSHATSQLTSLPSRSISLSRSPLTLSINENSVANINSDQQINSSEKKPSPASSQEELRNLRLTLALSDNPDPVNLFPSTSLSTANKKESAIRSSSPTESQSNESTTDLMTVQENHRQSPRSLKTNSEDNHDDLISLTTISKSERSLSNIDNL